MSILLLDIISCVEFPGCNAIKQHSSIGSRSSSVKMEIKLLRQGLVASSPACVLVVWFAPGGKGKAVSEGKVWNEN